MKNLFSDISQRSIIEADMAWDSEARPERIEFRHSVPDGISSVIISLVSKALSKIEGGRRASLASLKPVSDPAGHYRLTIGKGRWFLRVTRRQRKDVDMEDLIAFYLSNAGIKVNLPAISNVTISWKDHSYLLYIFPLVDGRHFDGSGRDLKNLSKVIAAMHEVLKRFKFADKVYANALKTVRRISDVKRILSLSLRRRGFSIYDERSDWMRRNCDWLRTMAQDFNPYLCLNPAAQCIHGELHLGNVLFSLHDDSVILTDFEEAPDAWFPPSFDLAYLAHRFCMDRLQSKSAFHKRLAIVESSYGPLPSDLRDMMRQVCWYNMALLIDRNLKKESTAPEEEYDKFVRLENLTNYIFS